MTNLEAIQQARTDALVRWLGDGHELSAEIKAELRTRGVYALPTAGQAPFTVITREEIHEQHLEDLGMDV